jgi:signal transduction histidine kinase
MKLDPESESSSYLELVEKCSDEVSKLGQMLKILGNDYYEEMRHEPVMPCILASIQDALAGTSIALRVDCPENLPEIIFFAHQLQLVFSSLAINAVEAMLAGGTLHLTSQVVEITEQNSMPLKPGTYIHILLADTGAGINPEILPKIFDPYFSTKERTSPRGIGMRLALCRIVIMKHGGIITAESTPGSGATFHIWLPTVGLV